MEKFQVTKHAADAQRPKMTRLATLIGSVNEVASGENPSRGQAGIMNTMPYSTTLRVALIVVKPIELMRVMQAE